MARQPGHTDVLLLADEICASTHKVKLPTSERLKMLDRMSGPTNLGFWDL
jgi:hypothetical protein